MKIAMVAPVEESVPPKHYGGTEVVIYNLITELVYKGHDVTLFGTGDSEVPCKVVSVFPKGIRTIPPFDMDIKSREAEKFLGISKVLYALQKEDFDIVHNHHSWRFLLFHQLIRAPIVTTLHWPLSNPYQHIGYRASPNFHFVSISNSQRKDAPDLPYIDTIYNGIDMDLYDFGKRGNGYLMFLGRFTQDKGVEQAMDIAKQTGRKLLMACKIDVLDRSYYESMKHHIDGKQIQLLGELGQKEKARLLAGADALLAPVQWEEPFGLFVIEAMASGTPVIGTPRGALPELIEHGKNGFLGATVEEMVAYLSHVNEIDRLVCRKSVEDRFTKQIMSQHYIDVYTKILGKT